VLTKKGMRTTFLSYHAQCQSTAATGVFELDAHWSAARVTNSKGNRHVQVNLRSYFAVETSTWALQIRLLQLATMLRPLQQRRQPLSLLLPAASCKLLVSIMTPLSSVTKG
jgi:hypothetical protein